MTRCKTLTMLAPFMLTSAACAAPASTNGATLFRQKCQSCHVAVAGATATIGPNLSGVFGRTAGVTSFSYSTAMKTARFKWTKADLDMYLASPSKKVPGTKMVYSVPNPAERKAIIEHLSTVR